MARSFHTKYSSERAGSKRNSILGNCNGLLLLVTHRGTLAAAISCKLIFVLQLVAPLRVMKHSAETTRLLS